MISLGLSLASASAGVNRAQQIADLAMWFFASGTFNPAGTHADSIPLGQAWFFAAGTFDPAGIHDDSQPLV